MDVGRRPAGDREALDLLEGVHRLLGQLPVDSVDRPDPVAELGQALLEMAAARSRLLGFERRTFPEREPVPVGAVGGDADRRGGDRVVVRR